ncbi:plasmid stabilization system protein [Formosa sp. Hel1_33_131]|jgi:plasmid stabilization system protein ParE|uniref:type II toxin-antitoxin system RelE/ParE family toxin n=1 Tax=Formosa sp. Hel1_33_131 TaxID=1336794 RepID=UPI00084E323B|nr:type II toxin-antitoxin system RelE/ParE family toxin [Formosa sp. Hel1_33_131]AOR27394.1 plasmid stabilization system protein [Formosa sp. Hel1_33_131]
MNYIIIWSNFAEYQLDEIFNYYTKKVNVKVAQSIMFKIRDKVEVLIKNPLIGEKEELLEDRKQNYRRLIVTNYKIIYSLNEKIETIKIVDIFDTRQNPIKLKRN